MSYKGSFIFVYSFFPKTDNVSVEADPSTYPLKKPCQWKVVTTIQPLPQAIGHLGKTVRNNGPPVKWGELIVHSLLHISKGW